jgi:hypothetical protein
MWVSHVSHEQLPRHRQAEAYAAVVVEGRYVEGGTAAVLLPKPARSFFMRPTRRTPTSSPGKAGGF